MGKQALVAVIFIALAIAIAVPTLLAVNRMQDE